MRLATSAKQTWLVSNSATAIWNTYLPNLQQQRYAPLLDLLLSVTNTLLGQHSVDLLAAQLTALVTATALAAEHAALLAVLTSAQNGGNDAAAAGTADMIFWAARALHLVTSQPQLLVLAWQPRCK